MVAAVAAALITAGWCSLLPRVGPRWGFVDRPQEDDLKIHTVPAIPLAGPGLLVGLLVGLGVVGELTPIVAAGLLVFTGLGVVDDRWQLTPSLRITVEVGAGLILSLRWWDEGAALALAGALVVVVAVNAVNLYDGIDTLAGATGAVGLVAITFVGWSMGGPFWVPLLLAAALVGFLPFNRHPARVFLGDGGAYLVGAVTAVALWDVGTDRGWAGAIAALGMLGMFGVDLVVTLLRRLRERQPLFEGDRRHLYDLMISGGLSVNTVTFRLVAAHLLIVALCAAALLLLSAGVALAAVAAIGLISMGTAWTTAAPIHH